MNFVFYTHSDYSDIWPVLKAQTDKYLPHQNKILFTNEGSIDGWESITYDDSLSYRDRVVSCLEQLTCETIVFNHEDMFLYDAPNLGKLEEFEALVESDTYHFIKLLRNESPTAIGYPSSTDNLLDAPPSFVFTIQPTICKVKNLITMYSETDGGTIWEFEANTGSTSSKFKLKGAMIYDEDSPKRGLYHWDSSIYPYVATAVVKGKWNLGEYEEELDPILKDNKINVEDRGTV